jgi:hypothetical protein
MIALNEGDFDRVFTQLTHPEAKLVNRSSSAFPDRSAAELRASFEDLHSIVDSWRTWNSVERWLDSTCGVVRLEREAVGTDGERYAWTRLFTVEARGGQITGWCAFELDDEDAAFAYAEERVRANASRLAVTNRASRQWDRVGAAMRSHDIDAALANFSSDYANDDRRRLSGHPVEGFEGLRAAVAHIFQQYNHFEGRTLAVRGQNILLAATRWSNDDGFESTHLHVIEINDEGLISYEGRFDDDDFAGAYRELTRRYCAGEGTAVADGAAFCAEWLVALNTRDLDRLIDELTDPDMRVENRSRSAFPHRSPAELRTTLEQLDTMIAQTQVWNSAEYWLDPTCLVTRNEREARGQDGEQYVWTRLFVFETHNGRCTHICEFELDDEEAAFAYAEERVRRAEES